VPDGAKVGVLRVDREPGERALSGLYLQAPEVFESGEPDGQNGRTVSPVRRAERPISQQYHGSDAQDAPSIHTLTYICH